MLKVAENVKPDLRVFLDLIDTIAVQFGSNCEVALHDLRQPQSSLVAMSGNLTNRPLYAPITNFVLKLLQQNGDNVNASYHYYSATKDNRKLKASTTFLKDSEGHVIGCICINFCIEMFLIMQNAMQEFSEIEKKNEEECYDNNIYDLVENILNSVLGHGNLIVSQTDRNAKLRIVKELEKRGLFLVKGSVELVAKRLGISKYTLYSYIDDIK